MTVAYATGRLSNKYVLAGPRSGTGSGTNAGGDGDAKLCQANPGMLQDYIPGSQLSPSSINLVPA